MCLYFLPINLLSYVWFSPLCARVVYISCVRLWCPDTRPRNWNQLLAVAIDFRLAVEISAFIGVRSRSRSIGNSVVILPSYIWLSVSVWYRCNRLLYKSVRDQRSKCFSYMTFSWSAISCRLLLWIVSFDMLQFWSLLACVCIYRSYTIS